MASLQEHEIGTSDPLNFQIRSSLRFLDQLAPITTDSAFKRAIAEAKRYVFSKLPGLVIEFPVLRTASIPLQTYDPPKDTHTVIIFSKEARTHVSKQNLVTAKVLSDEALEVITAEAEDPQLTTKEFMAAIGFNPANVNYWNLKDRFILTGFSERNRVLFEQEYQRIYQLWIEGKLETVKSLHNVLEIAAMTTTTNSPRTRLIV